MSPLLDTGEQRIVAFDLAETARACRRAAESLTRALRPTVYFLEDDAGIRKAYRRLLRDVCDLTTLEEPERAIELINAQEPDLLLTDRIGLPLLPYFRAHHPGVPVVVLSGQAPPGSLPLGVDAWYHKPFLDGAALKEIVQRHAKGLLE